MWELFAKGGPVMVFLLLCSLLGLYIIFYKMIYLWFHRVSKESVERVKTQLTTIGKEETYHSLMGERKIMGQVIASAIKLSELSRDEIQDGIKETSYLEIPNLEKGMPVLSSLISIAPLLGLLGTILGLMDIFNVISGGGFGDAEQLSSGIAQALITTVAGLSISIPFIFFNHYLSHRIDKFVLEMEGFVNEIVTFCKNNQGVRS